MGVVLNGFILIEIIKMVDEVIDIFIISIVIFIYILIDEKFVVGVDMINISVGKDIAVIVCYFCGKYLELLIIVIGGLIELSIYEIIIVGVNVIIYMFFSNGELFSKKMKKYCE